MFPPDIRSNLFQILCASLIKPQNQAELTCGVSSWDGDGLPWGALGGGDVLGRLPSFVYAVHTYKATLSFAGFPVCAVLQ